MKEVQFNQQEEFIKKSILHKQVENERKKVNTLNLFSLDVGR